MNLILWSLGVLGHLGIWATIFNQLHATACPRSSRKLSEKIILAIVFLPVPLAILAWLPWDSIVPEPIKFRSLEPTQARLQPQAILRDVSSLQRLRIYGYFCVPVGAFFLTRWLIRKLTQRVPTAVVKDVGLIRDLSREPNLQPVGDSGSQSSLLHGWFAKSLGLIPFNQVLLIETRQLELRLDVPLEFDGFRICHLSDLHFTGHIDPQYFQQVVEIANDFQPQLTLITGDLLDQDHCIPWIAETLGKLRAQLGCYFVLGNHDLLVKDQAGYLAELRRCGLQRVSAWTPIRFGPALIQLAGNELPWYPAATELPVLPTRAPDEFRLLLTHSPDQFRWALPFDFDLILAGHNHGGQIRFPWIGPVIVPSRYGVQYASGNFEVGRALMHVSRGISGDEPLRINCPPELGLITIRSSRT